MASLAAKIAALRRIVTGEAALQKAVELAIGRWFKAVKNLIFPAGGGVDLSAFAGADHVWVEAIRELAFPVVEDMFGERFRAVVRDATITDQPYRDEYMETVASRLTSFPASVFEEIRPILVEAIADGESIDDVTARLTEALSISQDGEWRARRIARTEIVGASNAGTWNGAVARSDIFGETLFKEWLATSDDRTRPHHVEANGQVRPLLSTFTVGESHMQFPGDPAGSASEVINCRCALLVTDAADEALTAGASMTDGWRGILAPLNTKSGDGRMFVLPPGGLRVRQSPVSLTYGHLDDAGLAPVIGRIDRAWIDGANLMGEGPFASTPEAMAARDELASGMRDGISVQIDDVVVESRFLDTHGATVDPTSMDEDTFFDRLNSGDLREIMVATDWRLAGAGLVVIGAFDEARIEPVSGYMPINTDEVDLTPALLAAGECVYDADMFVNPELTGPTALTVTGDMQVYGHIAIFGQCHVSMQDVCTTAPKSKTGYSMFHLGEISTSDGPLAVGKLTVSGSHADARASVSAATSHYDNTATAVAVVRAGEDQYGIWVAGAILPTATTDQIEELRRSPISGDWRRVGGNLELVAALAVNVPGFPVPRVLAASGALIASGPIRPQTVEPVVDIHEIARQVAAIHERKRKNLQRMQAALERSGRDNTSRARAALDRIG